MKYKVIGWTYYDDDIVLDYTGDDSFAQRNAIIDNIRKHKYTFSGWHHQESYENCVPILNDGRKRIYSQRGWGGIMAEAYGKMGDYDYASFTFKQSIDEENLKFPRTNYSLNPDEYLENKIENESFKVTVSKELFELAKTQNPFYLEDENKLKYIDINDTLTIKCGKEELTFLVDDIGRNKKEVNFTKHGLIKGKYKIIVTYRPKETLHLNRSRLLILPSKASLYFNNTLNNYDYNVLYNLFYQHNFNDIVDKANKEKAILTLKLFLNDYLMDKHKSNQVINILNYINDFDYYKDIAYKFIKTYPYIIQNFVKQYMDSKENMDKHILKAVGTLTKDDYNQKKLVEKAIDIKPNSKKYRKIYYKLCSNTRISGFPVMVDLDLYDDLYNNDKRIVELNKHTSLTSSDVLRIAEYFSYPLNDVTLDDAYPYYPPKIFTEECKYMISGVYKYQIYCKENFDIEKKMSLLFMYGINKKVKNMNDSHNWEEHVAKYIYALDALSGFKYEIKNKTTELYKDLYPELIKRINQIYSLNKKLPLDKYFKTHFEISNVKNKEEVINELAITPTKIINEGENYKLIFNVVEKYGIILWEHTSDILFEVVEPFIGKETTLANLKDKYNLKYNIVIDSDAIDIQSVLILDGKLTNFLHDSKIIEDLKWKFF